MNLLNRWTAQVAVVLGVLGLAACSGGGMNSNQGRVGRFVVTANGDGSLSVFRAVNETGGLVAHSVFKTPLSRLRSLVATPTGETLYAIGDDGSSGVIQIVSLDQGTGRIAAVSSRSVGNGAADVAVSPDGRHLYVASGSQNGLSQFAIEASGLTKIGPNPPSDPLSAVAIHPSGEFVYTLSQATESVQAYIRDQTSGALTDSLTTRTNGSPRAMAFNRSGTVAYVTLGEENDNVQIYDVDPTTGRLTYRGTVSAGNHPVSIVVDAAGSFAYTANDNSNDVTVFAIDAASGSLSKVQSSSTGRAPRHLTIDPTGRILYTADFSSVSITRFAIDPITGKLSDPSQVRARSGMYAVAVAAGQGYAAKVARFVVAPDSLGIHLYRVADAKGTLDPVETYPTDRSMVHAVVDPVTNTAYAVGLDNEISSYPFGTPPTSYEKIFVDSDAVLKRLVLEPSGQFLFALDNRSVSGLSGQIYTFRIEAGGSLREVGTTNTGRNPENLIVHPGGRHLYSIDSFGDTITLFELNLSTGRLSQKQTFTPGRTGSGRGRPLTLAFHPNGRYAYVTLQDDKEIVRFHVDEGNGYLESPQRLSTTDVGTDGRPRYIAVHPSGGYATVTFWGDVVATYEVNDNFTLRHQKTVDVTQHPSFITMDPAGQFAYVTVKNGTVRLAVDAAGALGTPIEAPTGSGDSSFSRAVTIVTQMK